MSFWRILVLAALPLAAMAATAQAPSPAQSPRDAILEVIFATDQQDVERHLPKATLAALRDSKTPASVREAFFRFVMMAKTVNAEGGYVSRGQDDWNLITIRSPKADPFPEYEGVLSLDKQTINGEEAVVKFKTRAPLGVLPQNFLSDELTVRLRAEDGLWKVSAVEDAAAGGYAVSVALDDPAFLAKPETVLALNESGAVGSLRVINQAEMRYSSAYPGFACSLRQLGPPPEGARASATAAGVLDASLALGTNFGYRFAVEGCAGSPALVYRVAAVPVQPGVTGRNAFCTDQRGAIYSSPDGMAQTCFRERKPYLKTGP